MRAQAVSTARGNLWTWGVNLIKLGMGADLVSLVSWSTYPMREVGTSGVVAVVLMLLLMARAILRDPLEPAIAMGKSSWDKWD